MKTALEMIMAERDRQVAIEGWTAAHDDAHTGHQLTAAADCYELAARYEFISGQRYIGVPSAWPWEVEWWKPKGGVVRLLVMAGALRQAEQERLLRRNPDGDLTQFAAALPGLCMMIDRVTMLLDGLDGESLRVLRELRDHHYKIASEVTATMRVHNSATEDERLAARLHESFVEVLERTIRVETNRGV